MVLLETQTGVVYVGKWILVRSWGLIFYVFLSGCAARCAARLGHADSVLRGFAAAPPLPTG